MRIEKSEFLRANDLFRRLVPRDDAIFWHLYGYWDLGANHLAVEIRHSGKVPGVDLAEFICLDRSGQLVGRTRFYTGWRHSISRLERATVEGFDGFILRMDMEDQAAHVPLARAFYSLVGTEAAVIRLELENGDSRPNNYTAVNWTVGPSLPERTVQEWVDALRSADPVERLRSLVWLEGSRKSPYLADSQNPDPRLEEVAIAAVTREVVRAVGALRHDSVPWIREAAARLAP